MAPMAMAMPPNDMMLVVRLRKCMAMKEMMIAIGSVIMTTSALGTWKRKIMMTTLTMRPSSISFSFKVAIDFRIRSERS